MSRYDAFRDKIPESKRSSPSFRYMSESSVPAPVKILQRPPGPIIRRDDMPSIEDFEAARRIKEVKERRER